MNQTRAPEEQETTQETITTPSRRGARRARVAYTANDLHLRVPHAAVAWQLRKPGTSEWLGADVGGVVAHRFPLQDLSAKNVRKHWGSGNYEFMFYAETHGRQHPVGGVQAVRVLPFRRTPSDLGARMVERFNEPERAHRDPSGFMAGANDFLSIQETLAKTQAQQTRNTLELFQGLGQTFAAIMNGKAAEQTAAALADNDKWKQEVYATLDGILTKYEERIKELEAWRRSVVDAVAALDGGEDEEEEDDDDEEEDDGAPGERRITPQGTTVSVPGVGIEVDAEPIVRGVVNTGKKVAESASAFLGAAAAAIQADAEEKKTKAEADRRATEKGKALG